MLSKHTQQQITRRQVSRAWSQIKFAMINATWLVIIFLGVILFISESLKVRGF